MIDKNEVIAFFDSWAPRWDSEMVCNDFVINTILDNAGVHEGAKVLDVACGTGVLVPYYLDWNVSSVLGVDISPKMIEIAKGKFLSDNVTFVCTDAETGFFGSDFDCIVIYNAFPHFSDADKLICNLGRMLKKDGILTVAHGMSREKINSHHRNVGNVSNGLMPASKLADLLNKHLDVTDVISDDRMYQVCGKRI